MAVEGGMKCVKFLVFIFNFIFWVSVGLGEVGGGAGATGGGRVATGEGLWDRQPRANGLFLAGPAGDEPAPVPWRAAPPPLCCPPAVFSPPPAPVPPYIP